MWPFLFILAIVPLIFFWSDSVLELFPQLAPYLPGKAGHEQVTLPSQTSPDGRLYAQGVPGHWTEAPSPSGYVAWLLSADGQYRLAVGCRPNGAPAMQLTQLSGEPVQDKLTVNYQFGTLELNKGVYAGPELVGATAQFADVLLSTAQKEVIAQFQSPAVESGVLARTLSQNCPEQVSQ